MPLPTSLYNFCISFLPLGYFFPSYSPKWHYLVSGYEVTYLSILTYSVNSNVEIYLLFHITGYVGYLPVVFQLHINASIICFEMLAGPRRLQTTFPRLPFQLLPVRFYQQKMPAENQKAFKGKRGEVIVPFLSVPGSISRDDFISGCPLPSIPAILFTISSDTVRSTVLFYSIMVFLLPFSTLSCFLSFCPTNLRVLLAFPF